MELKRIALTFSRQGYSFASRSAAFLYLLINQLFYQTGAALRLKPAVERR